jgi:hypothetical protein
MELSSRSIKVRLFLTCCIIFVLHFATDFVREHYLVLSIVEDASFRLDKYVGLHHDIFETPNHGAHHGANPGASMIAAIPAFLFKPVIKHFENYRAGKVTQRLDLDTIGEYKDHRAPRVKFYKQVRERGLDIKFGLIGVVTMVFCMAPISALGAVVMMGALGRLGISRRLSLWLAILYAFGTPVFFRTAYLNQNLMVGIFAFVAFVLLWKINGEDKNSVRKSMTLAGFLAGLTLLCDYSGLIPLFMLYAYAILRRRDSIPLRDALKDTSWYLWGAVGPILLLWFYQWASFGHPFYPPQYSMPAQIYSDIGYQGIRWPSAELFWMLLFDYRFGLFVVSPILLIAFFAPILSYFKQSIVPLRETIFILGFFAALVMFFTFIEYTRLQWITGIRYIVPVIPFLFLLTAAVLVRMPRAAAYGITFFALGQALAVSMARRGVGVPEESMLVSIKSVLTEGLQLPWLNTLSKMGIYYVPFIEQLNLTALFLFVLCAVMIYGIWRFRTPREKIARRISSAPNVRQVPSRRFFGRKPF